MSRLILASASLQRKTLLEGLGLRFEVLPSAINEEGHPEKDPKDRAAVLARLKAQDIASKNKDAFVIGCDTLVVTEDGELLEKPKNADDARRMVATHSNRTSAVYSAVCIVGPNDELAEGVSVSFVQFKTLTDKDLDWWISTGLWKDRSGAFQIDGPGQLLISSIEGDWTGIVGLPIYLLGTLLTKAGFSLMK